MMYVLSMFIVCDSQIFIGLYGNVKCDADLVCIACWGVETAWVHSWLWEARGRF